MSPTCTFTTPPATLTELLAQFKQLTASVNRLEQQLESGFASCQTKLTALEQLPARFDRLEANVKFAAASCQNDSSVSTSSCNEPIGAKQEPVRVKLPVKIMETIFQYLTASQLAAARTVCRRWNRIIGTSVTLMDNFLVEFPAGTRLQADCEPVLQMVQSKTRITRAYFDDLVIFGAAAWWPAVNDHLHSLSLIDCHVSIDMVLGMLRGTPTLKSFEFQDGTNLFFNDVDVDFQLERLEVLDVAILENIELLEVFGKICPNLKTFILFVDEKLKNATGKILKFVQRVQDTLVHFEFQYSKDVWHGLLNFKNLKLTRIASQDNIGDRLLIDLCRNQRAIDDIYVKSTISDPILNDVGRLLKNLDSLSTSLQVQNNAATLTFLDAMPKLATLAVTGSSEVPTLSFRVAKHPKLDTLRLELWQQAPCSNWFKHFPNLQSLELDNCILASWSDLFVPITQLKELKNLTLAWVDVTNSKEYLSDYLDNLTFLSLQQCEMTKSILTSLIPLCKNLEEIHLYEMDIVDDDIMLDICQKLPKLATLVVAKCQNVKDVTVRNIPKFCTNVEEVTFKYCKHISAEAVEQMKVVKSVKVSFQPFVEEAVDEPENS